MRQFQRNQPKGMIIPGMKLKSGRKTIVRLLSYIGRRYKWQFIIVLLCIFISGTAAVASSQFLKILIDGYITPTLVKKPVTVNLIQLFLIMVNIYAIGIIASYIYNRLMVAISQGVLKAIRDELYSSMQYLPLRYFDTHSHGEIMSFYTNDIDTLRQMLSQSIPQMFSSIITIIAVFITMIITSVHLTLIVIGSVFLMLFIAKQIGTRSGAYFGKQQAAIGSMNGFIEEMIHGQKVIKVFTHEKQTKDAFNDLNETLALYSSKANTYANIFMPVMANMGNFQYIAIAVIGGILEAFGIGYLTLGTIAAFLQLSKTFSMPVSQVSQQMNSVIMALAGAERIFAFMDEPKEEDAGDVTLVQTTNEDGAITETSEESNAWAWKHVRDDGTVNLIPLHGDVEFKNVTFGYTDTTPVLTDITLYAKPGKKVALVGSTGAGKTTITNLINRFYDIDKGTIEYDGIPIKNLKKADLRRSFGMVLQDTHLFTDSVRENIRYGNLNASDKDVEQAAKLANADSFIQHLPKGYDTLLSSDGTNLSQGQRQLLSIARAAIANPPAMILDEATSSVDTRTESHIEHAMNKLMEGRTIFIIAHRLSTVQNADIIMVLEHGSIIERGTHKQLLEKKGKYYQLHTGVFELD